MPKSIQRVNIYTLKEGDTTVQSFLENCIHFSIAGLSLNQEPIETVTEFKLELGPYLESILKVMPKIDEHLDLHYFSITGEQLEKVVKASPHMTHELVFTGSDIIISEDIDFVHEKFKLENLNLDDSHIGSLHGEEAGAKRLIDAIAKCGLKDSLTKIDRWNCNITSDIIRHLLAEHEITKIWIED